MLGYSSAYVGVFRMGERLNQQCNNVSEPLINEMAQGVSVMYVLCH